MRFFNTAGPMVAEDHYCIAPLSRIDQGELLTLIANKRYFVLHAPRQTGKTSALLALRDLLNGGAAGAYRCVYANVESAQAARENKDEAMRAILGELAIRARRTLGDDSLSNLWPRVLQATGPAGAFREVLGLWAEADRTPLVLRWPCCGSCGPATTSVRMAFRKASFCAGCATCATTASAPARRTPSSPAVAPSTSRPSRCGWGISPPDDIHAARERLILRRETHLDQLTDKLQEERVRRVVEPLLTGGGESRFSTRDLEYGRDLGLIAQHGPLRIANPIYAEVVPRELAYAAQEGLVQETAWYVDAGGALNLSRLLAAFQEFFREHSEHWIERFQYREAGPQLLLQAFLQRIVNSGGRIEREYGLGRMRTDLLIIWPAGAEPDRTRRMVIECKLLHRGLERTIREGLTQTRAYMERCGAAEGHLVVFDRTEGTSWDRKMFRREETAGGPPVTVWGM